MTVMTFPARVAGLFAVAAACLLLGGCVLASKTNLIATSELAWPFAGDFTMFPYSQAKDANGFTPTEGEGPTLFAKGPEGYASSEMTVEFVKLGDDTYLIGAGGGGSPGELYGVATLRNGAAGVQMVFSDSLKDSIEAIKAKAPAEIAADISFSDGGIEITQRATLDYLVGLIHEGSLPTEPVVAYLSTDPKAAPPARLVPDGTGGFKPAD
jgi:hypothetical protein